MANTTNLNLSKLAGTEKLKTFPSPYNDNMDAIDGAFGAGFGVGGKPSVNAELNSLADGLAIIANGNTHAAITSGQYVYVRGHGTLADGLYQATANIAQDETLSGSNLTADSSGGLNSVYSALNGKLENGSWTTVTVDSNTNYTVPNNGTLYIYVSPSDGNLGYWIGTISDWRTIRINFTSGFNEAVYIPVCAGDVIKFASASSNITSVLVQFRKMR